MKKIITPISEKRLCKDCKHRHKEPEQRFGKCEIYKAKFRGDELLVSKRDKKQPKNCPLLTAQYNERGLFYAKKRIPI